MSAKARALLCAVGVVGALGTFVPPATGVDIRTETDLGGFSIRANAAPLKVLIDDPSNPLPRPEESAIVEVNPAYTQADLATGPASVGLASSLWPGNLLGTGLPTATEGQISQYPIKAESRYPDKPYTANGSIAMQGQHIAETNGAVMTSSALGLDAAATAKFNPTDLPGTLDVAGVWSHSTATVNDKNVAIGHSISKVSDVSLLGGAIRVGSVSTVVETTSDGKAPTSSGSTVVTGLQVAGQGFTVDEQGAHQVGGPGTGPLPTDGAAGLKAIGITIDGIVQSATKDAETATRSARGLRITVDTTIFRNAMTQNMPGPLSDAIYTLFNQAPQTCPAGFPPQASPACALRGFLYYSMSGTPKITFILGAGESTSSAIESIDYDFGPPIDLGGGFPTTPGNPGTQGTVTPPTMPGGAVVPTLPEAGPTISQPDPVLAGSSPTYPKSPPVSALLVLGALIVAGISGWGLTWLRGFAFGAGLLGAGCALGAPSNVPSLHPTPVTDGV